MNTPSLQVNKMEITNEYDDDDVYRNDKQKEERAKKLAVGKTKIRNFGRHLKKSFYEKYEVQSLDLVKSAFSAGDFSLNLTLSENTKYIIKLLEDVGLLMIHLTKSIGKSDYVIAIINFIKLRTDGPFVCIDFKKSLIDYFFKIFGELQTQSEDIFSGARELLDRYESVCESEIFKKLYKFGMYALSFSLFEKLGVTFNTFSYSKIESEMIRKKFCKRSSLVHTLLDTLLFICERGYQCMKTGSLEPIFHSGKSYEKWFAKVQELKRNSLYMNNPEPHGLDRFSFLADVNEAIEKGESILKFTYKLGDFEKRTVSSTLNDLKMIKSNETTRRAAQKERAAPFSVLLYGGSSIGKSTLTKLLFYHYGKLFNLPTDSEFKYTRNPVDDFWSGFDSTKWCVQLDDIAFMHPNKAMNGDPSLNEMLQVVNNVPFVPNQADLGDKGRTPMKAKFVIATTNTEHLNAYSFYSCPLAIRRRLPFVIDVQVKPEYLKDGCMLDTKGHIMEQGDYPDYWQFIVKRVVPMGTEREGQRADLVTVEIFSDVYKFIKWFSQAAKDHEIRENTVSICDGIMSQIQLCKECSVPEKHCTCVKVDFTVQSYDVLNNLLERNLYLYLARQGYDMSRNFCNYCYTFSIWTSVNIFTYCLFKYAYFEQFCFLLYCSPLLRPIINCYLSHIAFNDRLINLVYRWMGTLAEKQIGENKYLKVLIKHKAIIMGAIYMFTSVYTANKLSQFISDKVKKRKETPKQECNSNFVAQNNELNEPVIESTGRKPEGCMEERENVWYKNDYTVTNFDVSPINTSYLSFTREKVHSVLLNNTVTFLSRFMKDGRTVTRHTRAVCVTGHIYMCNNHGLPDDDQFHLSVVSTDSKDGINSNISFLVVKSQILRFKGKDLAFIKIRNLPPKKDITQLFCKETLNGSFNGVYLQTNSDGLRVTSNVRYIRKFPNSPVGNLGNLDVWCGTSDVITEKGDCGAILLAESSFGPIILGIHVAGDPLGTVASLVVTQNFLNDVIQKIGGINIQSGVPLLSAPSAPRVLGELHWKSPIRYIAEGTADVYGSFLGFRGKSKSSVTKTLINDSMLKRGYQEKFGAPVMTSWQPWRHAVMEAVTPITEIDQDILDDCVNNFTKDILSKLTSKDLSMIHVYDDITTVNGAPGVSYVDKINRNTSVGNPWKKSKKYFMRSIPAVNGVDDPVEFVPEVMDRVKNCLDCYKSKSRYVPVFSGSLKDEARTFEKIAAGKVRVFTGSPGEFTFVERKYLLCIIRVIQNNRYIFEAAPGTIAQSTEWEEMRKYLTHFGDERMVAGDFKAFDKQMSPLFILAAGDVIMNILKEAGYSEEELTIVQGILTDIAFPMVDMNGDLVMFYGSNPSGHALTVIINSLVNSLYMRYAYAKASGRGSSQDFKTHIHLMTYGDDNVMGISKSCPWFSHTTIQNEMAAIGVTYTMADKSTESIPYIHISEVSFLKRTWRFDEELGIHLAPLEHGSIEKMLLTCVKSKSITFEEQTMAIIGSAVWEYFFYGKNVFEEKRDMLLEVVKENNLEIYVQENTFPTWSEMVDTFWRNSRGRHAFQL
jgi:hypothetical protein